MAAANDLAAMAPGDFRTGTLRGTEGFFRVGEEATGRWWLIDATCRRFYVKAVHGVRAAAAQGDSALPIDSAARLRAWGFNTVGASESGAGRDDGLPFLGTAEFCDAATPIVAPGLRLPDVFEPEWTRRAAARAAEVCAPWRDCRELIGWMADDGAAWAQPSIAGRPSLLQLCLSLEPSFAAYHAAWEFVLALHGGRLESLARAWAAPITNKETVRELTRAEEGLGTRGYLRDEARWTREFARRYFTTTAAAVRAVDPNHLVLGCRFRAPVGGAVLSECVYPAVDVALPHWSELSAFAATPVQPFLAGDVGWTTPDFLKLPAAARVLRLTSVEWMLRRARTSLDRVARHPAVVGYAWGQWQDQPGEQPPFASGLVHVNGAEAREHTELLTQFNVRAESLHRSDTALVSASS